MTFVLTSRWQMLEQGSTPQCTLFALLNLNLRCGCDHRKSLVNLQITYKIGHPLTTTIRGGFKKVWWIIFTFFSVLTQYGDFNHCCYRFELGITQACFTCQHLSIIFGTCYLKYKLRSINIDASRRETVSIAPTDPKSSQFHVVVLENLAKSYVGSLFLSPPPRENSPVILNEFVEKLKLISGFSW